MGLGLLSSYLYFLLSAFGFIVSRLSFLLAMVLPWRILAIASGVSSKYSEYFILYSQYDTKQQIMYLGATVVALFAIHIALDLLFDFIVAKGAEKNIEKSNKSGVFNNYRTVAKRIYKYYATFFSASLYILLAIVGLLYTYSSLIIVLIVYTFITAAITFIFYKFFYKKGMSVATWLPVLYKTWWHIGFILALIWAINDYWKGIMPEFLLTFFALLLYRQLLVMMTVTANNGHQIYKNRIQAGQIFSSLPNASYQSKVELNLKFEQLVNNIDQQEWLVGICESHLPDYTVSELDKQCRLVEAGNVAYITLIPKESDGILIKLFNTNREALAEQELLLLEGAVVDWPLAVLIQSTKINNYSALVYSWPKESQWLEESDRTRLESKLRESFLACQLAESVITQYEHSHANLLNRLDNVVWEQLQAYSGSSADRVNWENLPSTLNDIYAMVLLMPKQLCLRSISSRMMFGSVENPQIVNVARWAWEPIGAAWPLRHLKQLDNALTKAAEKRDDLVSVNPEHAKIVARLYEFERRYRNKNYVGAVNVLSNLLNHYGKITP